MLRPRFVGVRASPGTPVIAWLPAVVGACAAAYAQAPTTLEDFFQPGSQPTGSVVYDSFRSSAVCNTCHLDEGGADLVISAPWQGSMMAQAARDPLFYACLDIANQDAASSGDLCIRCHTPGGWISGRSTPSDGSALTALDRDGVSCSVCHRMVDPVFRPGISPAVDEFILADIDPLPISPGGGNYVLDPADVRRGPYDDIDGANHAWLPSPFHRSPALCGTCHDVSNPAFERRTDGTYALTMLDTPHPTADKYDMFPLERTYSEWLLSEFATQGVDMKGRFGGSGGGVVSTCQDCHMPVTEGKGCKSPLAPLRTDLAAHDFAGGNAWVQDMVANLYPDEVNADLLEAGKMRSVSMLQRACSLELTQIGNHVNVRIVNDTGHKLPTGYPEGRRMWINVEVYDALMTPVAEYGRYDAFTADLATGTTKVYEAQLGIDAAVASATGLPEGKGFHFAVNNVFLKDNRIPPRGFANAAFQAAQAAPVEAKYADGQYWDDTRFRLPPDAASVTVRVYYQTSSKEYITFLRDANPFPEDPNNAGRILYDQWELTGKSPPVLMAERTLALELFAHGDYDGDGGVTLFDYSAFFGTCQTGPGVPYVTEECAALDFDDDGDADQWDFAEYALRFGSE